MKRLSIIISIAVLFALIPAMYFTVFRIQRSDWVITDAEITFISSMNGTVEGTFTDINGVVHSDQYLYTDGKFQKIGFIKPMFPSIADPQKYIGKTVRIMYDPESPNLGELGERLYIVSYDNWLRDIIISMSVPIVLLAAGILIRITRKKAANV